MRVLQIALALLLLNGIGLHEAYAAPEEFSTRGQISFPFIRGTGTTQWVGAEPTLPVPASLQGANCPSSIVIYIHGFQNDAAGATKNFAQVETMLAQVGYPGRVYGFSWDSNPGVTQFPDAERSANLNGKVLAKLLKAIKASCPGIQINIITHSLGARVALSALKCGGCVASTHLIAAAVKNEVLEPGQEFGGGSMATNAGLMIAWHNDEDDVLGSIFPYALGSGGSENGMLCLPRGVYQLNATPKLIAGAKPGGFTPNPDIGGISQDAEDDHSGYIWSVPLFRCIRKFLR